MATLLPDFAAWPEPPGFLFALFGLAVLGTRYPIDVTNRRRLYYALGILALGAFSIMGLRMIWVFGPAMALGAIIPLRLQYILQYPSWCRFQRQGLAQMKAHLKDLIFEAGAYVAAMMLVDFAYGRLGTGTYPLPVWRWQDMLQFLLFAAALTGTWFLARELGHRVSGIPGFADPPDEGVTAEGTELLLFTDLSIYGLVFLIGWPLWLTMHYAYMTSGPWVALIAMGWAFYMNTIFTLWIERRNRLRGALHDIQLSERLAAIGNVTARILHQMRHQLGLMAGSTYIIQRRLGALPPEEQATVELELTKLDAVREQLRRILTDDLQDETEDRGASGPSAVHAGFRLREIALLQTEALSQAAAERGISIEIDVSESIYAPAHPQAVGEAIFNVVENAVCAATSSVRVTITDKSGVAIVEIVDNGTGIAVEELRKATQPFYTTKPEGTGMGLAIALSAAKREGGELKIANRAGGGLEVCFEFPLGKASAGTRGNA